MRPHCFGVGVLLLLAPFVPAQQPAQEGKEPHPRNVEKPAGETKIAIGAPVFDGEKGVATFPVTVRIDASVRELMQISVGCSEKDGKNLVARKVTVPQYQAPNPGGAPVTIQCKVAYTPGKEASVYATMTYSGKKDTFPTTKMAETRSFTAGALPSR